jgi:tetratricopeptide (TPR) repeat protein
MTNLKYTLLLSAITCFGLVGCSSQPQQTGTLGDLDKPHKLSSKQTTKVTARSKEEIKKAYYDYVKDADQDDKLRIGAVTRIAELELALDEDLKASSDDKPSRLDDTEYEKRVRNTIALLSDTLEKFPDAPGNDHLLYQLAKAHDQVGEADEAVAALEKMVRLYPQTPYFVEAKFRIGETAFVRGHYLDAELAYTDVIGARGQEMFTERSLFKRGWARYKQELYEDALDDYFAAVKHHDFDAKAQNDSAEQELFGEYFRAIGLAFIYLGGHSAIGDYFNSRPATDYIYQTYQTVADLQLKQERYSDAVATYDAFINAYPYHAQVIEAGLAVITIWKDEKFFNQYREAFSGFYQRYQPDSNFWRDAQTKVSNADKRRAFATIRENIVLLAGRDHSQFRSTKRTSYFEDAKTWYDRYLKDYSSYAQQDKIYQLYAELLRQANNDAQALYYYEQAAFDGEIILDKDSAYAAVFLTDKLQRQAPQEQQPELLNKHLSYAQRYAQLYPGEQQSALIVQNAVQKAFRAGMREQVISLSNILPDAASTEVRSEVNVLKAQAYFDLNNYPAAENVFRDLLVNPSLAEKTKKDLNNKLALSIYRQAESAVAASQPDVAAREYLRILREVSDSELAPVATYDAIAIFMDLAKWDEAIHYLNVFKKEYPQHPLQSEVAKKLSVAYLNADRGLDAAREFERLSGDVESEEEKIAALWQAAELYRQKADYESAVRAYRQYAHTYKRPYAQNMEAMARLAEIYAKIADDEKRAFWLREMVKADTNATKSTKTERTQFLAAGASFDLAERRQKEFEKIRLIHPLPKSLQAKKSAMQDAVKLYGQAAVYGHAEFVTGSTLAIGEIYRHFSVSLLESERPRDLNADELEQYNILLEDQAFPFEDKAIEFYETNVGRIAQGVYDPAIKTSLEHLRELFPARYGRTGKVEVSITKINF